MAYGKLKVDTLVYDNNGTDQEFLVNSIDPATYLRLDSNGNLGIGVSTVSSSSRLTLLETGTGNAQTLEIKGANSGGVGSQPGIKFTSFSGDNIGGIFGDTGSDAVRIQTSGADRMYVTNAGNIGIGIASPRGLVHLHSSSDPRLDFTNTGTGTTSADGATISIDSETGTLNIIQRESQPIVFNTSNTERMRLDSSGRLLVGTSISQTILGSAAGAQFATTAGITSFIRNTADTGAPELISAKSRGSSASPAIVQSSDAVWLGRFAGYDGSNYIEAARISGEVDGTPGTNDMPGRLIFSTSADGASTPTERVRISNNGVVSVNTGGGNLDVGSGTTDGVTIYPPTNPSAGALQTSTNGGPAMYLRRRSSNGTIIDFRRDTTSVGSISVTTTATAYNTSSDYRLKENVANIADGITRVKQLAPKRFNFIADADTTVDGFLAHEAQAVVPEAVTGEKDGEEMQGIDQSKFVPLLTAALQEAITKIEALEQRLTDGGL